MGFSCDRHRRWISNFATKLKFYIGIDDALDLAAEHAIGGVVGLLANAFFASNAIIKLDGVNYTIQGGFLDHNWKQLYIQIAYICATVSYSFVVTAVLAMLMNHVPGLHLRSTEEGETLGMDDMEIGEFANDYIEVRREYTDWTGASTKSDGDKNITVETHVAAGDRHGRPDIDPHTHSHMEKEQAVNGKPHEDGFSSIDEKPTSSNGSESNGSSSTPSR